MLKTVIGKNFESWEKVQFELHEGVNVFLGLSDKGKSGLFRLIRWALRNAPSGDAFVSDFRKKGKATTSILTFDDDSIILRSKKGVQNVYEVNDMQLSAFGTSIPNEVTDVSRMNDINIQRQIDQFFLLTQTAGERGKFFNRLAGIDKIDSATKYATAQIKAEDRKKTNAEEELERITDKLKNYDDLDELQETNQKLRTAEIKKQKLESQSLLIERLNAKRDSVLEELSQIKKLKIKELDQKRKKVLTLVEKYNNTLRQMSKIKSLHQEYTITLERKESTEKQLVSVSEEFNKLKPKTCPLCKGDWK